MPTSEHPCQRCGTMQPEPVLACPNCDPTLCACGQRKYSANADRCSDCAAKKAAELLGGEFADYIEADKTYEPDPDWPARNSAAAKAARAALDKSPAAKV